jgi:hypothetical protein
MRTKAAARTVATMMIAVGMLTACGSGSDKTVQSILIPGPAQPGDITSANVAACDSDRQAVQMAIDTYTQVEGAPPKDQKALVDAGYLRESSPRFVVNNGVISPTPGGPCA